MSDAERLLIANLTEAFQQLQRYVVVGLGTSVSALALALAGWDSSSLVQHTCR